MDAGLLGKIFGMDKAWHGPCTIIMDAEAAVSTVGTDSLLGGGAKQFAPRIISGRISCDSVCLLPDAKALVILQHLKVRQASGEEVVMQPMTVADISHIVAVELLDTSALAKLGLTAPPIKPGTGIHRALISATKK